MNQIQSSFRDPSGIVFESDGNIFRQINKSYQENYDFLISSGLYYELSHKKLLISHEEVRSPVLEPEIVYKIIKPKRIKFISHPYEWSFTQLKDAALLTLHIQSLSLTKGMILKDASAFNIQFLEGKPIFIDTLSFIKYEEGAIWEGYKQFCQHFLSPLVLMSFTDVRLSKLLINSIDGIPLDLARKLLPFRTWFNYGLIAHIHLHSFAQFNSNENLQNRTKTRKINRLGLIGLIESLEKTIKKLNYDIKKNAWADYYQTTNYSNTSFENKKEIVKALIDRISPETILDLGANTGVFSRLGKEIKDCLIISADYDPDAVEIN